MPQLRLDVICILSCFEVVELVFYVSKKFFINCDTWIKFSIKRNVVERQPPQAARLEHLANPGRGANALNESVEELSTYLAEPSLIGVAKAMVV